MNKFFQRSVWTAVWLFGACQHNETTVMASGSIEADEITVSAQQPGRLLQWQVQEGQVLGSGQNMGWIDTMSLFYKKKQIEAQMQALNGKKPNIPLQLSALQAERDYTQAEYRRFAVLETQGAATAKQVADIKGRWQVLEQQIQALQSSLQLTVQGLNRDSRPLYWQWQQTNDQCAQCQVRNPTAGTVLTNLVHTGEWVAPGKPLYVLADLNRLYVKAYVSGADWNRLQLGQSLNIRVDGPENKPIEVRGRLGWISSQAEFTPKNIPTPDERQLRVYAIKIWLPAHSSLKIGQFAEITKP